MGSVARESASLGVHRRDCERGQALVEFALIVPLFLMIVVGIIQFGVALNYWLDLQRVANQGARWAAVDCGQSASPPPSNQCMPDIEEALRSQLISSSNEPRTVEVCWITTSTPDLAVEPKAGDSVRVRLTTEFSFLGITGFLGDESGLSMDLNADATMRLEVAPTLTSPTYAGVENCPP